MRLDRYLCKSTELNAAEAREAILARRVEVKERIVLQIDHQVYKDTLVTLDGAALSLRPFRYLAFHKQKNTVCSNVDDGYPSIFRQIDLDRKSELHVVGRLDADTTGLVLLTDDGSWTYKIITPKARCSKVYRVTLRDPITAEAIQSLEQGILLQGCAKPTLPAKVTVLSPREVKLTLTQGKYHQVKRMVKAVGNRVHGLHREQVGNIKLDLDKGEWRQLSRQEVASFI